MLVEVDGYPVYVAATELSAPVHLPRIVLIHGAQNDHSVWVEQLPWFAAQGFAVFAPDLPGHGQSSGPLLPSIELMGQWLGRFINTIFPVRSGESPPIILIGHSMGSLAALECASDQRERISALVMVGTAFPMKVSRVFYSNKPALTKRQQLAKSLNGPMLPICRMPMNSQEVCAVIVLLLRHNS
ncbi:MAG: alpha/beta fold hydrolase [Rhodocyclaceae bacterium]|nr:alpha/beta fold hydrolase [Rhodocyclaceae bacterium]